jgi:hypothetical protein
MASPKPYPDAPLVRHEGEMVLRRGGVRGVEEGAGSFGRLQVPTPIESSQGTISALDNVPGALRSE